MCIRDRYMGQINTYIVSEMIKSDGKTALKMFEMENSIAEQDVQFYNVDELEMERIQKERPWNKNPTYFKKVKISSLALIKMVYHAKSGGIIEVMGLMQGHVIGDTFIVTDAFALPVEGTETRVNAGNDANEYMCDYTDLSETAGRKENVVGWYHSHPGYACWLSGIDVATQSLQQKTGPQVAVVIDPIRTMTAGKVEIGAFRTYPDGYTPPDKIVVEEQAIPSDKTEDFGVHHHKYYSLEVSFYKNSLDTEMIEVLWNKYWIKTLTNSSLFSNTKYFTTGCCDLAKKAERIRLQTRKQRIELTLDDIMGKNFKAARKDFVEYSNERNQAVINEAIKVLLFNKKQRSSRYSSNEQMILMRVLVLTE
eukprot:TRINITY_DN276_c0_g1_i3.p1 TRINITY_DN276_c0_g1~~TRINITY_DN276_c0_g1_i3.p1  ORF type:complete len:388 (+),score=115.94 TRINITY_DN276_c0_g1_i3:68-1165(+)